MRASISKPTQFIYLALEKIDPFIYLIIQNVDLFIYCPLIFCTHLMPVVRQIHSQFIEYQENKQPRKISERKYVYIPSCQKNGAFHIGIQKNRVFHILFIEKRGPIIYLSALKKGAIRHAHPYYAIYRKLPPRPPPPHPPPPPPRAK